VGGDARLLTRTGLDWTDRYEAMAKTVSALDAQMAYLDGELCAVRSDGTTAFSEMQAATAEGRTTNLVYFVFDVLFLDGKKMAELRASRAQRGCPRPSFSRLRSARSPSPGAPTRKIPAISPRPTRRWSAHALRHRQ
jgi:outer membrane murein-binding lipoprotein Lpp